MPSNIEDSDKQQTGQATKDESPAPSVEGESTVAPPEPSSEDRKSEQEPASVEETAEFIKRMSEEYSNSEFSTVRYISFVVSNTFKGLALGFICDSYLFGKEYFIYVFQVIYNVYNGVLGRAAFDIENPPSAGIFIDNITNPELLFIGVLILFSCLAFGMWDGWREDRIREYAIRDNKRAKKILETSRKLAHINKTLEKLAVTDHLTGLFNRRYAHQQLKRELSRSQRYNDPLCVLMVDIDHFKNVNDTYGHSVGDAVLAELARLFYDCLRSTDVACRYGGEEFLIILPCTSTTQGKVVARRILSAVDSTSFREKKEDIPLTVSIGLTATGEDFTLHFQELIRQADIAMYKSKSAGRNRLCVYSSSDREEFIEIFTFQPEDRLEKLSYKIVELRSSLRDTAISTIQSLVNAIGTRNSNLMEHLREVAYHARQMALIAGMESDEVEVIFRAALLHDIGKFGVPDSILLKVEPLNKHEWRVLEQHPEFGARILRPLGFMRAEAALIKAHHERYDGLGYPEGVKGDEIPLGAGIISVADAYSFMTTRHPFREAKTHDEAVAEIERLSGRQFHPKAVEAFMSYVRNTERINKSEFRSEKT